MGSLYKKELIDATMIQEYLLRRRYIPQTLPP
jgi:hypothetical protein